MDKKLFPIYKKIGLNVAYYRKMQHISQEVLAEMIGASGQQTISAVETAYRGYTLDIIIKIANALDVPLYKFFEFKD